MYYVYLIVNGVRYRFKSFFSPLWTEERVIESIFEVFRRGVENGLSNSNQHGCYEIIGKTVEGLKIKLIFDPKQSLITTAYPLIESI